MPKKANFYTTWFIYNDDNEKEEVDLFRYVAMHAGISAQKWNKVGLGSLNFTKGQLHISFGEARQTKSSEHVFFNVRQFQEQGRGFVSPKDMEKGLQYFGELLSNPEKMVEIEQKAYKKILEFLEIYLEKKSALTIERSPQYAKGMKDFQRTKRRGIRGQAWWGTKHTNKGYANLWNFLIRNIVLSNNPKRVGGTLMSFSLEDMLKVKVPSQSSTFTSIFMMEEFGTGINADENLRRPYQAGKTPWKVPPEIANAWHFPMAQYMWWPYASFRTKAFLLMQAKQKKGSRAASRWLEEARDIHQPKFSLKQYRETALNYQNYYSGELSGIRLNKRSGLNRFGNRPEFDPLELAYGRQVGAKQPGYPGRIARHLFYNKDGITLIIRRIQSAGIYWMLKYLDQEIQKIYKNFPSIARAVGESGLGIYEEVT